MNIILQAGSTGTPSQLAGLASSPSTDSAAEIFRLFVLPSSGVKTAQLLAVYKHATALEPFHYRRGAAGKNWQKIIQLHQRLRNHVDGKPTTRPVRPIDLKYYGKRLFATMFHGKVRELLEFALADQAEGSQLTVLFTPAISWVADKPWEFALHPKRDEFLALDQLHWIRNAFTALPAATPAATAGPLRVLVASAAPASHVALSNSQEVELLVESFSPLVKTSRAEVHLLEGATGPLLEQELKAKRYDVLHFVGHGYFSQEQNEGGLLLEGPGRSAAHYGCGQLAALCRGRGIRLVFLNACESGRGGRYDFNRGLAPGLVAAGVPAVVANQFKVLDGSALEFARKFYRVLADGETVAVAVKEARRALSRSIFSECLDWAVPVIYARDPGLRLTPTAPEANNEEREPTPHLGERAVGDPQVKMRRARRLPRTRR